MVAVVFFHGDFDHGAFLTGKYDQMPRPGNAVVTPLTTEDEVFGAWVHGGELPSYAITADPSTPGHEQDARVYHVDEATGEMWTLNPETGAALSSDSWTFDE